MKEFKACSDCTFPALCKSTCCAKLPEYKEKNKALFEGKGYLILDGCSKEAQEIIAKSKLQ